MKIIISITGRIENNTRTFKKLRHTKTLLQNLIKRNFIAYFCFAKTRSKFLQFLIIESARNFKIIQFQHCIRLIDAELIQFCNCFNDTVAAGILQRLCNRKVLLHRYILYITNQRLTFELTLGNAYIFPILKFFYKHRWLIYL